MVRVKVESSVTEWYDIEPEELGGIIEDFNNGVDNYFWEVEPYDSTSYQETLETESDEELAVSPAVRKSRETIRSIYPKRPY